MGRRVEARYAARARRDLPRLQSRVDELGDERGGAAQARRRSGEERRAEQSRARRHPHADGCVRARARAECGMRLHARLMKLSLIHISEPTRQAEISYAVFCLKK